MMAWVVVVERGLTKGEGGEVEAPLMKAMAEVEAVVARSKRGQLGQVFDWLVAGELGEQKVDFAEWEEVGVGEGLKKMTLPRSES